MILFKNNEFKNAFITCVVIIYNYACLFIAAAFSIVFCNFLLTACAYLIILMITTVCFFCYLKLILIYLKLKIFQYVKNLNL